MSQTPPEPQGPAEPQLPPPPGYGQPSYQQPPTYQQPPSYAQPPYAQPSYAQPSYAQPSYAQPSGHAMPGPMQYGPAADSRNVLGILALVAPFVGFSAVGIVLGHLGLSAVKKGLANNKGIALAGTIVSWVFTVFAVLGIVAAILIPVFLNQQDTAHEAAVKSDLMKMRLSAESYYVDNLQVPPLTFADGSYYVGNDVIAADSAVSDARLFSQDGQSYCIEVDYGAVQTRSIESSGQLGYGCY